MNIIEVKELKKNYNNLEAVKGISFNVEEGSFFAFLGENGAGKSTTINILCTILSKTKGQVIINGYDIDKSPNEIKKLIGIVFQNHVLDDMLTVKENLFSRASYYGFSKKESEERIKEITQLMNLSEIYKQRYDTLSGGQKRRVDIARALINKPRILFLDEPTTGLDPQTRKLVWENIHQLQKETGLTVFLTTHYMEEAALCDKVVILDNGTIVAHDTPHELKKKYSTNKLIWYLKENKLIEDLLNKNKLSFEYENDYYIIKINDSAVATNLIINNQELFIKYPDYEIIKGDMDDVFLNVTGKKLGETR